jgi:hypothetical protein
MDPGRRVLIKFATHPPKTYPELRAFIEKERPDWLQALMPRRINAPSEYWPQKVLALATIQAALSNQVMQDAGLKPDATFVMVECQTGHLLQFDVPTFYVSKELLAASARTDLQDNTFLDAVPFPFPASVFMFPKGTIRHPSEGECPYIVVSRVAKGQVFPLPLKDVTFATTAADNSIVVSTYLPDECRSYHKSINVVSGETMKNAFERASAVPFEIPGRRLSDTEDIIANTDADFMDRLWLLGITLVFIMASGENLLERGVRLKSVKPKNQADQPVEYWSPNYLGRVYQAETEGGDLESHQRPHWRKGHLKSQPHGPRLSLRKIIWIQPYRTGHREEKKT